MMAALTHVRTTSRLYWIGLYEDSKKWEWFFQVDLAPGIGYCTKRVVGEVMWLLFLFDGLLFISLLGNFLGNLAGLLFVITAPHIPRGAPWGIYIVVFLGVHVLWYSAVTLARYVRARGPGGQWAAVRFVNAYGPPGEKYGFRKVLRIFCGIVTLVGLSIMFYHHLLWLPLCARRVGVVSLCTDVCEGDCIEVCGVHEISEVLPRCERPLIHSRTTYLPPSWLTEAGRSHSNITYAKIQTYRDSLGITHVTTIWATGIQCSGQGSGKICHIEYASPGFELVTDQIH
jgi:hypothetical protein